MEAYVPKHGGGPARPPRPEGEGRPPARPRRGKGPLFTLASVLLIIIGAMVFSYPAVSSYLAEQNQITVIQEYQAQVQEIDMSQIQEEWARAREYNENLAGDPVHDPFVPGSGFALPENYLECLNLNGVMAYIQIPKIDVYLPIYHGTSEEVLEKGVGHIESTALPIGGDFAHPILTGHRGLPSAKLFTDLDRLEIGDLFYIHVLDQTLAYEVDLINVVEPDDLQYLSAEEGKDLITLVTCTPYAVNTHRLLVRGSRTTYVPPEEALGEGGGVTVSFQGMDVQLFQLGAIVGLIVLLFGLVFVLALRKPAKDKRKDKRGKDR